MTANDARGTLSPGEILEQLRARNENLADQLAKAQGALSDRRRLQDLSPDELAMESVGAAGEIIKAARMQAQELRNAAQVELDRAREEGQAALRKARARADQVRSESELASAETLRKAREESELIMERVREDAATITEHARASAEASHAQAQEQYDRMQQEAQVRLQAALVNADQSIVGASAEAARIVAAAERSAQKLQADAQSLARGIIAESLAQIEAPESLMNQLLEDAASLRSSVNSVVEMVRQMADHSAAEAANAEAATRSYLSSIQQMRTDLERRLAALGSPDDDSTIDRAVPRG
ncbi:MAG: hypothetical protein ACYC2Z_11350 [Candidatus Nanopelagicales bacterium]